MKKRNSHWKTNQTHIRHSGPLDEHKQREADRIGNKLFNGSLLPQWFLAILIPFVLAYKYPQVVAFGYPIIIFLVSMACAIYVSTQTKKTGITTIDPEMLTCKEKKQLHYPGLKAGLVYGVFYVLWHATSQCLNGWWQELFHLSFQFRSFHINSFRSILFRINNATCRLASHSKSQGRSRRLLGGIIWNHYKL